MTTLMVYTIIILIVFFIIDILWHSFWSPFLLNTVKLSILNERKSLILYCNQHNFNKKIKKNILDVIDVVYDNISSASMLEFLLITYKTRNSNQNNNVLKNIYEESDTYIIEKINIIYVLAIKYMIFSSIIFTIFFFIYFIYNYFSKFGLNIIGNLTEILNYIGTAKLFNLFTNLNGLNEKLEINNYK